MSILDEILAHKRGELAAARRRCGDDELARLEKSAQSH